METLGTIILTLVTVLGGNAAWKYYEHRLNYKLQQKKLESKEDGMHINDLRSRIEKLELLLQQSSEEKEILRAQIIDLTAQTSTMKIELDYLLKENQLLKNLIGDNERSIKQEKRKRISKKRP